MRMSRKRRRIGAYSEQPPEHLLAAVRGIHERARRYLPILLYRVTVARADDLVVTNAEIASLSDLVAEDPETIVSDILALRSLDPAIVRGRENDRMKIVMALRECDDDGED